MNLEENLESLIVDKSRPLLSIGKSGITLGELKILDTYLARINPTDPENRLVTFKKSEFEHLLGVKMIKKRRIAEEATQPDAADQNRRHIKTGWIFNDSTFQLCGCVC